MAKPQNIVSEPEPAEIQQIAPDQSPDVIEFVSFSAIADFLAGNARVFALMIALSIVGGIFWIVTTDRIYEATVKLAASTGAGGIEENAIKSTASILQNFTLAGGSITGRFAIFREKLFSVEVANQLATEHGYLKILFADQWNPETGKWVPPDRLIPSIRRFVRRLLILPDWHEPTRLTLLRYIEREVEAVHDSASDIVELTYRHRDPDFALKLLTDLVASADRAIRMDEQERTSVYINYLGKRMDDAINTDLRTAFAVTLVTEERKMALSQSELPFAAEYLDRPSVTDMPVSPTLVKTMVICVVIGILLGFIVGFARPYLAKGEAGRPEAA